MENILVFDIYITNSPIGLDLGTFRSYVCYSKHLDLKFYVKASIVLRSNIPKIVLHASLQSRAWNGLI